MLVRSLHPRTNSQSPRTSGPSKPIPPSQSFIDIPADQYLHSGAPTEWWWHIGALRAGDRVFGFEINAASYVGQGGFGFTQVMLSDVTQNAHYQQTTVYPPGKFDGAMWAQSDPTKDWYARMGDPIGGSSYVVMEAPWWQTLTNKSVGALLADVVLYLLVLRRCQVAGGVLSCDIPELLGGRGLLVARGPERAADFCPALQLREHALAERGVRSAEGCDRAGGFIVLRLLRIRLAEPQGCEGAKFGE